MLSFGALRTVAAPADAPLTAWTPIVIPGGPGGFDWMLVDGRSNRVFATHKGTKSVAIVDLKTDTALPPVDGRHGAGRRDRSQGQQDLPRRRRGA